ncbi:MAG: rRNA maturation RNase YbeY [Actinomycetota bacterium]
MISEPGDPSGSPDSGVVVEDEQDVPLDTEGLRTTAARALEFLGVPAAAGLSVTLVDPEQMAELKQQALGVHAATDVLSFPMDSLDDPMPGPLVLGDIVVCPAVAARQAAALGHSMDDEMSQLLVHGILHVLGWDHDDAASERAMRANERRVLSAVSSERTL